MHSPRPPLAFRRRFPQPVHPGAVRKAKWWARSGRRILPIEVDETTLILRLVDARVLKPEQADDWRPVAPAVEHIVEEAVAGRINARPRYDQA